MVEQAQGIQEREAPQEIPRPIVASPAVPQKTVVIIRRNPRASERKLTLTLTITRLCG